MPILDVEMVTAETLDRAPEGLAQRIADASAAVFGAARGRVWVKLRTLPVRAYAENDGREDGVLPVFVRVVVAHVAERVALEREATALARAIASATERPVDNTHIIYEASGAGRVAFGGRLV